MNEPNVTTLPKLLNESQAAAYLGFSKATLVRLRKAQRISHIALSPRMIRYRQQHLDEYTGKAIILPQIVSRDSVLLSQEVISKLSISRTEKISGVYFLLDESRIVYVGQSRNILSRIRDHHFIKDMQFDRWYFQRCPLHLLLKFEAHYIAVFRPRYNQAFPPVQELSDADLRELAAVQN